MSDLSRFRRLIVRQLEREHGFTRDEGFAFAHAQEHAHMEGGYSKGQALTRLSRALNTLAPTVDPALDRRGPADVLAKVKAALKKGVAG